MTNGSDHHIRQRAYEIWEEEGRPEGKEADHWRRAQEELSRSSQEGSGASDSLPPVESLVPPAQDEPSSTPSDAIVDQDFAPPPAVTKAPAARKRKPVQ